MPGTYSQCSQYNVSWAGVGLQELETGDPGWAVVPCQAGWEYDTRHYHVSATQEMDWVCDKVDQSQQRTWSRDRLSSNGRPGSPPCPSPCSSRARCRASSSSAGSPTPTAACQPSCSGASNEPSRSFLNHGDSPHLALSHARLWKDIMLNRRHPTVSKHAIGT